jgi:hypothetical protein
VNFFFRDALAELGQLSINKLNLIFDFKWFFAKPWSSYMDKDWINIDFEEKCPNIRSLKLEFWRSNDSSDTVFGCENISMLSKGLETLELGYVCGIGIFRELANLNVRCSKLHRIKLDNLDVRASVKDIFGLQPLLSKNPDLNKYWLK